jgi:hypothetical protein
MSTSWRMPFEVVSPASGCNEHSSRATTLRGRFPTSRLVGDARIGAHLFLTAFGMMEAQIVGRLCHQRVKRCVASEAKNVVGIVLFRPFHRSTRP